MRIRFSTKQDMTDHIKQHHNKRLNCDNIFLAKFQRHIKNCDKKKYHKFTFLNSENLSSTLNSYPLPIKWFIILIVNFVKYIINQEGELKVDPETLARFRYLTVATTHISEIDSPLKQSHD